MINNDLYITLLQEFRDLIEQNNWYPSKTYEGECLFLLRGISCSSLRNTSDRRKKLIELINKKLDLNSSKIKDFIDAAFPCGLLFNYRQKVRLNDYFNTNDKEQLEVWLNEFSLTDINKKYLLDLFEPISDFDTRSKITEIINTDANASEICAALWGGYIYHSFEEKVIHHYFLGKEETEDDFFEFLTKHYETSINRNLGLKCLKIDAHLLTQYKTMDSFYTFLLNYIRNGYKQLPNHTYLSIFIKSDVNSATAWRIYSKLILFAEKHRVSKTKIGYFHPDKIAAQTKNHISHLDLKEADFLTLNEGFTYKDCFILTPTTFENGRTEMSFEKYDMLILFEKNKRDETLIPCPACRSRNVRGNSYPILGVKSWECNNIFCPDRSKYNRGKRYSLASLIKQEAIEKPDNLIDVGHLKKWRLDVTRIVNENEVLELLLRHYTLHGDKIELTNFYLTNKNVLGRTILTEKAKEYEAPKDELSFFNSSFFNRYLIKNINEQSQLTYENLSLIKGVELYEGNCYDVLKNMQSDIFDGSVTSPPYYNAKNYSQWSNIYCYLYDMFNIATEVFRTLKNGAPYLFNIFDYFDNENSTVFSAMGDKRMILGSYIIDMFERIGFQLVDNIIWHKGEIQGKRNFNQGNNSPYYQSPFNCYEHIFLFSKNTPAFDLNYPKILKAKPVLKMFNGINRLGHEAPYPIDIPELLLGLIPQGSSVLDPFAGSMTTAKACIKSGFYSINIEYKPEYCKLGLKLLESELGLFLPQLELIDMN
jgi:DNA modification methylase